MLPLGNMNIIFTINITMDNFPNLLYEFLQLDQPYACIEEQYIDYVNYLANKWNYSPCSKPQFINYKLTYIDHKIKQLIQQRKELDPNTRIVCLQL